MLKAAIIYIPGSGGSFLRRVFSMSENSIVTNPDIKLTVEEKFNLFTQWNTHHWKAGERKGQPGFRAGSDDFYLYETSHLELVDAWHPTEFLEHDRNQQCWLTSAWQHLIFVNIDDSRREFIERNQKTKYYQVDWPREQAAMTELKQQYQDRSTEIDFEDLLDLAKFIPVVERTNQQLNLGIDLTRIADLWHSWHRASQETWAQ